MVSVFAPTEVPKEFATSLPPMLNAMNMPKMIVTIRIPMFADSGMRSTDHQVSERTAMSSNPPKMVCHQKSFSCPAALPLMGALVSG